MICLPLTTAFIPIPEIDSKFSASGIVIFMLLASFTILSPNGCSESFSAAAA